MTDATTWVGATAKQIARAVRRGDATATQVVADHLEQISISDPSLEAFRVIRGGEAITEAEKVDDQEDLSNLPLAGVPVAVKENTAVAGLPTWGGSAAARSAEVAEEDHEVVRRLRGAGAIVVGVTKMPEMGLWAVTDDGDGATRNPWDLDRTPGGSSGGAAAAVAAGLVPMAQCNDGLGSIRIPAACCGLVGLKPGRGVVPADLGGGWFGLVENGVLTTTVADAALGFSVLAGRDPVRLTEPSKLRIGVSTKSPVAGIRADEPNLSAVQTASRLLVQAGHDTITADPHYPAALGPRVLATWFASAFVESAHLDVKKLQPRTRRHIALGRLAMRSGLVRQKDRDLWRVQSKKFFAENDLDVLLTPALAATPPPADRHATGSWRHNMSVSMRYAPYAAPWNVAGLPAIVVPVGVRPDGLPLAVQFVGPPDSELLLLGIAGQLEVLNPWQRHAFG